eukprot:c8518_g1_i2.p1 GENE.c8518_g1_i2~~c8518_g1_i2.p1  ORF type:complete len:188 (-),score=35.16 c8518_g1_i2:226-789(-)
MLRKPVTFLFFAVVVSVAGECRLEARCAKALALNPITKGSTPQCGDGKIDVTIISDNCETGCTAETGFCYPIAPTSTAASSSTTTPSTLACVQEQCDDHNTTPDDGCSANCQLEGITYTTSATGVFAFQSKTFQDQFECLYPSYGNLSAWESYSYTVQLASGFETRYGYRYHSPEERERKKTPNYTH